jgi:type I restriction enzyme M protein
MITDTRLHSQVDQLWEKLWTGGLTNPLDAIEQLSFLLFLKRMEDEENLREKRATMRGQTYESRVPADVRWSYWTHLKADDAMRHVRDVVFPWLRNAGATGSSFERYMQTAEFKINKASLLIEACSLIDNMQITAQNQDVQGDLYEYLLAKLNTAGRNGQFRTPRHIIRMMVQMLDPRPNERIGDLAAGTCGFLVNAYQHILERNTPPETLKYDADGWPHNLTGELLTAEQHEFLQNEALRGFDNDSGMTMLRIGSMNLMLHGIDYPRFYYTDTLSKSFTDTREYDVILMNPPFKGAVDKADVNPTLPSNTTKSELLFLHLILRALDMGGRAAVIVPDGVLFGSSKAHVETRRKLIEHNRLDGVVSMPSGVFRPYAGVSTAILFFTRGATTDRIWYYDMEHDGFSLDDKRLPVAENDIPDVLKCWRNRNNADFATDRAARLSSLRNELAPLKAERLNLQADMNRLLFESAIASTDGGTALAALDTAKQHLAELKERIHPLQDEFNRLSRQFWVSREELRANKYDLSASRYRQVEQDDVYYESSHVTIERLIKLEDIMMNELAGLDGLLK